MYELLIILIYYSLSLECTETIVIPEGETEIKVSEYENCKSLINLKLPESLITISYKAFSGCSILAGTLTIPNSVKTIGDNAFNACSLIKSKVLEAIHFHIVQKLVDK